MTADEALNSLLEPKKLPSGSSASISLELQELMPFTSKVDYKALDVAVRYCKLTDSYDKSQIKTGELEFGKWLVSLLYERKKLNDTDTWGGKIGVLLQEPTVYSHRSKK